MNQYRLKNLLHDPFFPFLIELISPTVDSILSEGPGERRVSGRCEGTETGNKERIGGWFILVQISEGEKASHRPVQVVQGLSFEKISLTKRRATRT